MRTLTFAEWNKLIDEGKVVDVSGDLKPSFLYFGQIMRAKVKIVNHPDFENWKMYYVSAWSTGEVNLVPEEETRRGRKLP